MIADRPHRVRRLTRPLIVAIVATGIALVGWIDFITGIEYRVNSLYYLPLSLAAWSLGGAATTITAALCTAVWFGCNYYGGLDYSSSTVWIVNVAMQAVSFVVVGLLLTTVRRALARAEALSRTDSMTWLLNSRAFAEDGTRALALARRYGRPVTLAYIDLDNFKLVNDTLGHRAGDEVLHQVGERLRQSIREADIAARIGGDEFAVLLPETGPDGAGPIVERLRRCLDLAAADGSAVKVSVGAICCLEAPASLEELVRRADLLMYGAKSGGKDRIRLQIVQTCDAAAP